MKTTLSLTHNCNLNCNYCYAGKSRKKDMSWSTAQKAVDFSLNAYPGKGVSEFSFFGGEPFLCFDLMKDITQYIYGRVSEMKIPVRISVTTNGTIFTRKIADFLEDNHIDLCVSIDGTEHVHNANRRFRNGRGSFQKVTSNLEKAVKQLSNVQVNSVFGAQTIEDLPATVRFLVDKGITVIHLNPDIMEKWDSAALLKIKEVYRQISEYYIDCFNKGKEVAVNLIDGKMVLFLKGGYGEEDKCSMGEREWGVAPSGNVYPCERFIGDDTNHSLCLGNVHFGVDSQKCCAVIKRRGNRNPQCNRCDLQKFCMNWCGCTNYHMTGTTDLASAMLCESESAAIGAARHVFSVLAKNNNNLFMDHLLHYVHEGQRYH